MMYLGNRRIEGNVGPAYAAKRESAIKANLRGLGDGS